MAAEREKPEPLTLAELEAAALRYLDRFDATTKKLRDYLSRFARKRGELAAARALIDELVARYQRSGLLDDARFARVRAESLRARGASTRKIELKLQAAGVERDTVSGALGEAHQKQRADLEAARAFVRRKRLGRYRPEAEQQSERRRDLARLARQGFDFDTAIRALELGREEDF